MPHRRAARVVWANLAVIALIVASAVGVYAFHQGGEIARSNRDRIDQLEAQQKINDQTHSALCAQRDDLDATINHDKRRVRRAERFLQEHPAGFDGVPLATIIAGLRDDVATLNFHVATRTNLDALDC